jgi:hypothetical protein
VNAHDNLERQLRASVAQASSPGASSRLHLRAWSRGLSALLLTGSIAVAAGVGILAIESLGHGRRASQQAVPSTGEHRHARLGKPPKDPGPIPRNVQDGAVAAAWNTAWAKDPACSPPPPRRRAGVTNARPNQAMLSIIPALRRSARPADRLPASSYVNGRLAPFEFNGGEVFIRYIRRARTIDGTTFYLVPVADLGRRPLSLAAAEHCYRLTVDALQAELPNVLAAKRAATRRYGDAEFALGRYNLEINTVHQGLFLVTARATGGGGADGGQSPSTIQRTGMLGGFGGGKPPTPTVMDGIVPAGVATVTLHFPPTRFHGHALATLNASGPVINNVFVIPVPTLFKRGGWPTTETWRSASGKIIKVVNERPFHP